MSLFDVDTGIIVVPPFRGPYEDSRFRLRDAEQDAQLCFYLTYFKHVVAVALNGPMSGIRTSTVLEQQMKHAGVVVPAYPTIFTHQAFDGDAIERFALPIFHRLNSGERGRWALAPPEDLVAQLGMRGDASLVLTMRKCLPSPRYDVPIDEIVSFREAHEDELSNLRRALYRLRYGLSADVALDDVMRLLEQDIAASIAEVHAAVTKAKFPFALPDLKLWLTLGAAGAGGVLGSLGGPVTAGIGAIAGAAIGAGLENQLLSPKGNAFPPDFQYVASGFEGAYLEAGFEERWAPEFDRDFEFRNNTLRLHYPAEIEEQYFAMGGSVEGNFMP